MVPRNRTPAPYQSLAGESDPYLGDLFFPRFPSRRWVRVS
jgi:hypothetical protein